MPSETMTSGVYSALKFLQQRVPGLHVAARARLALQGFAHNLGKPGHPGAVGDSRFTFCRDGSTSRFPAAMSMSFVRLAGHATAPTRP